MSILKNDNIWLSLYKNRLKFFYNSINEYALSYKNNELEEYCKKNYNKYSEVSSIEIFNSVAKIINVNIEFSDTTLKEYNMKLFENETSFIDEINKQNLIMAKVKKARNNKEKFEEIINIESIKLLDRMGKIYNHFIQTIDRVCNQGIKNNNERKVIKIIELLHCFKQNLYNYFVNKI
ncbi:MAG: hypothetical protein ACRC68_04085, partial [Clostridium sp.]